jgi:hypothetical protein
MVMFNRLPSPVPITRHRTRGGPLALFRGSAEASGDSSPIMWLTRQVGTQAAA